MRIKPSFLRRAVATVGVCLAVALTATHANAGAADAIEHGDGPRVTTALGGGAIVTAAGLVPGEQTEGTLKLTNDGDAAGRLGLQAPTLADHPGPGGGTLSRVLTLVVTDVTGPGEISVYRGSLRGLRTQALGRLDTGETRSYRFQLRFDEDAGNASQGSAVDIDFAWSIRG